MNPAVPEALAHCLATEAVSRPLEVEGLGTFHVRRYGDGATHRAGVLFLAGPDLRRALDDGFDGDPDEGGGADPGALPRDEARAPLFFGEWLARTSRKGPEWASRQIAELAAAVLRALAMGETLDYPALGRFTTRLMAPMTVTDGETGASRHSRRRVAACFTPSDALRRRLERG